MPTCLYCDETKIRARGMCSLHYIRWHTGRDLAAPSRYGVINYATAHYKIRMQLGDAYEHACIECGKQALDWAYNHNDPNELMGTGRFDGFKYSLDARFYQPRCRSCHNRFDRRAA